MHPHTGVEVVGRRCDLLRCGRGRSRLRRGGKRLGGRAGRHGIGEHLHPGGRIEHAGGRQVTVVFDGVQSGTPEYDAWMAKLNTLERFNGRAYFTNLPAGGEPVTMTVFAQSMVLLDQAHAALKDSVYDSLILQTRLEGIVNGIDLVLDNDTLRLDLSGAEQAMMSRIAADPVNGMVNWDVVVANDCFYQHAA